MLHLPAISASKSVSAACVRDAAHTILIIDVFLFLAAGLLGTFAIACIV
jgi:hypothetical protein